MPFDPIDFDPHRLPEPTPEPRRVSKRDEDMLLLLVLAFAIGALVLPIGGGSIVQLFAYLLR